MFHSGPERANWALVGLSAAIGAGRLGAAFLLRVLGSRRTILISAAVAVTGAMIVYSSRAFAVAVLGMVIIGLGLAAIYPTALGLAGDRFPRQTGTVFGAIMAVSLVGGTAGPSICGSLAATGLRNILWVPMVAAVAVATFTILATRESPMMISKE
jgi:MFS family permease